MLAMLILPCFGFGFAKKPFKYYSKKFVSNFNNFFKLFLQFLKRL